MFYIIWLKMILFMNTLQRLLKGPPSAPCKEADGDANIWIQVKGVSSSAPML